MIEELPSISAGATVQQIGEQSDACADALNALRKLKVVSDDTPGFEWTDSNAVLKVPGSQKIPWDVIVNGQAAKANFASSAPYAPPTTP